MDSDYDTIRALIEDQLIESSNDVVSTFHMAFDDGYPTPSVERDGILKAVLPKLEPFDSYSRGRSGAWKYEVSNQNHSLMQGVEWAKHVAANVPGLTMPFPETANAIWENKYKSSKLVRQYVVSDLPTYYVKDDQ